MERFLNLDYFFYLIYSFFGDFFGGISSFLGFDGFGNLTSDSQSGFFYALRAYNSNSGEFSGLFGAGLGKEGGYAICRAPAGADSESWGFFDMLSNFFINPYDGPSFFEIFFGGINSFFYLFFLVFLILIIIVKLKDKELDDLEGEVFDTIYIKKQNSVDDKKSEKWEEIKELIKTENPNDWKNAIIEADKLLFKSLDDNGFSGETLGEKLKNGNFQTINDAWEAHKIRNKIAHDEDFILTNREAKKTIALYGRVFGEFYYIKN